jgi:hypothetical protein
MPDFISSIYTYPWDLTDEGLDRSLNRIADTAQCDEVMLTPSYHVSTYFLPHNPARPIYYGEDGAVYFHPDYRRFRKTSIRPHVSDTVDQEGYFERIVEAINKRGLKFGTWIVYCYNHYLARTYPEFAKHDAFGNAYLGQLSTAPPDAQEYIAALTENIVQVYKPVSVHVESLSRLRWNYGFRNPKVLSEIADRDQFLLGLDFNPAAVEHAREKNLDGAKFQKDVAEWVRPRLARLPTDEDRRPANDAWIAEAFEGRLKQWLGIQSERTTALWTRVAKIIHGGGATIQSVFATNKSEQGSDIGPSTNRHLDRVTVGPFKSVDEGRRRVKEIESDISEDGVVMVSTQPAGFTTAAPLEEEVRIAKESGAGGCNFYNFGLLREQQLGFVGSAVNKV